MRGVTARVYSAGRRLALQAGATSAAWVGDQVLFALGDGAVLCAAPEGELRRIEAHDGAILCAAAHPDGASLLTGGDDGKLNRVSPEGDVKTIADLRGKWIDHVVSAAATGVAVAGVGKEAIVFREDVELHRFAAPSSIGGLALDGKGRRLAISHYGGVSLRYVLMPNDKGLPLKWAGSHLAVTISPDADYVISAMQENELHGWKLPEKTDLRMAGYASKTRSFSWDKRGRWMAASGADRAVVWPFAGKQGPQGKSPTLLGQREALVTVVAFHPQQEALAIGYADGAAVVANGADQTIIIMDEPGEGPVTALAWRRDGGALAIGDEAGRGAIVTYET